MASKNVLLYHLIRVLTPEELNDLTTTSNGRNLVSLTKMLTEDIEEDRKKEEAKVLLFRKREEKQGDPGKEPQALALAIECGVKCSTILDDHVKRITVLDRNYSKNCPVNQETSTFIINEKDRFKNNYSKSKSKEILSLYKKSASLDIEREKSRLSDSKQSSLVGILINKKQA